MVTLSVFTLCGHLTTLRDTNTRSVTGRTHVRGGVPRLVGVCICIGVWLCGHFCGREVGSGGGGLRAGGSRPRFCASWFYGVGVCGWLLASFELRLATRLFSPPKFSFTPEPVYLDTKRRRQSTVPFSGHVSVRSNHAAQAVVGVEECNRLGSVFFRVLCASPDVTGLSVSDGYWFATSCVEA